MKKITIGERGNESVRSEKVTIKTKEGEMTGQTLATPKTAIYDPQTGATLAMRKYYFSLPVLLPDLKRPSVKELLNAHKGQIISLILKDGLEQVGEMRGMILKNSEQEKYQGETKELLIRTKNDLFLAIVPCKPRMGQILLEKATKIANAN